MDSVQVGNEEQVHAYFKDIMQDICDGPKDPKVKLLAANSVWVAGDIDPAYIDMCKEFFLSEVHPLGSAKAINEWVSLHTEGLINKILQYPVRNYHVLNDM